MNKKNISEKATHKKRIAIFASGSGTNAENIITYFQDSEVAEVVLVLSNKKDAKVLERAEKLNVDVVFFTKDELYSEEGILRVLKELDTDLIVLAGFLLKFPELIIAEFPNRIINIHPALLPKYGGKGMYGSYVHQAVKNNNDSSTGITIHLVNQHYDEGKVIFQKSVAVSPEDSPEDIAKKVHVLEHKYYPKVIESLL